MKLIMSIEHMFPSCRKTRPFKGEAPRKFSVKINTHIGVYKIGISHPLVTLNVSCPIVTSSIFLIKLVP